MPAPGKRRAKSSKADGTPKVRWSASQRAERGHGPRKRGGKTVNPPAAKRGNVKRGSQWSPYDTVSAAEGRAAERRGDVRPETRIRGRAVDRDDQREVRRGDRDDDRRGFSRPDDRRADDRRADDRRADDRRADDRRADDRRADDRRAVERWGQRDGRDDHRQDSRGGHRRFDDRGGDRGGNRGGDRAEHRDDRRDDRRRDTRDEQPGRRDDRGARWSRDDRGFGNPDDRGSSRTSDRGDDRGGRWSRNDGGSSDDRGPRGDRVRRDDRGWRGEDRDRRGDRGFERGDGRGAREFRDDRRSSSRDDRGLSARGSRGAGNRGDLDRGDRPSQSRNEWSSGRDDRRLGDSGRDDRPARDFGRGDQRRPHHGARPFHDKRSHDRFERRDRFDRGDRFDRRDDVDHDEAPDVMEWNPDADDSDFADALTLATATDEAAADAAPFSELGLAEPLVAALAQQGITTPFPIQQATIPDVLAGRDVLGRGKTGSGKTLAFGLPLLTRLAHGPKTRRTKAVILVPTRELALQVADVLNPLAKRLTMSLVLVAGGMSYGPQLKAFEKGVDVVVATPGRLIDLLDQGAADLSNVEITVLDEADHMADLGFMPAVTTILDAVPGDGQRLLFSATLDGAVDRLVKRYLHDPVTHEVDPHQASVTTMEHRLLLVQPADKVLVAAEIANREGRTVVFARTQLGASRTAQQFREAGVLAGALHGGLTQGARARMLGAFRDGTLPVLVATDVAARGIHVDDVSLVLQLDPPMNDKDYLHRAGRTARAGGTGVVASLVLPHQRRGMLRLTGNAGVRVEPLQVRPGDDDLADITGARPVSGDAIAEGEFEALVAPKKPVRKAGFGRGPARGGQGGRGGGRGGHGFQGGGGFRGGRGRRDRDQ